MREAQIENRREIHERVYQQYKAEVCNRRGEQESNLGEEERKGLKSLIKRTKDGEIIVMKTDKSGKFSVTNREKYIEMGQVHIGKDREVTREEIRSTDKTLNEHSSAWCSIWRTGQNHQQEDRVMQSKMSRSENRAKLYLSHKDHKKESEKTRPIGTANSSNTRAFANSVSDLLEAVATGEEKKYEVISSEDMLYSMKDHNKKVKELNVELEDQEKRKRHCWSCRMWRKKCTKCNDREVEKSPDINNIVEEIIEAATWLGEMKREKEEQEQDCRDCAARTRRIIERDCVACGEGVSVEDKTTSLVGMDAVALFPSMSGETTARIVRKRIEKSSLKFEGFNWKKAGIYILANRKLISHMDREVKKYLSVRRKTGGVNQK